MRDLAIGVIIGIPVGGALSYLYAAYMIAEYKKAAAAVGVVYQKVEGVLTAVKKAI